MEWKEVRLESILALPSRNGLTKPSKIRGKGVKMIGMGELFANPIIYDIPMDRVPVTDKELSNSRIMPGDLLFARQSLTLEGAGKCCYVKEVKEETVFESHLIRIRIDKTKADAEFIYYFFNSFIGKCLIQNLVTQVAAAGIRGSELVKLDITIPKEVEDQRRIASILSSLDRKIELNNKINADLEEMAQAIFKNWFVDFEPFKDGKFVDSELGMIPEGWKVGTLGDITKNKSAKVKERNDVKVLSPVTTGELVLSEEYFTKQVFSSSIAKYKIVNKGDFAYNPARVNIGSLGRNDFDFDGCVSPVYVVFSVLDGYENYFDLFRKTDFFKDSVASLAIGGVRQSLSYDDLSSIEVIIPSENAVEEFNNLYNQMKKTIKANKLESSRLSSLRDTLLPRLMSGELEVPE